MSLPNPPSGSSPAAVWFRRILDAIRSQKILPGVGYFVKETSNGTVLQINATGGSSQSGAVQRMRIKHIHGDYLICRKMTERYVSAVAINNGGSGYSIGNTLTVAGGKGNAATLNVDDVTAGTITSVSIVSGGNYTEDPSLIANAVTGAGSSATMDLTMHGGETGSDINVAKPPELRWFAESTTQTIESIEVTFVHATRVNNDDGKRTASATGENDQIEIVIPIYQTAADGVGIENRYDEIYADQPTGGTGVIVSNIPLTWMDTNRAGRAWCQIG